MYVSCKGMQETGFLQDTEAASLPPPSGFINLGRIRTTGGSKDGVRGIKQTQGVRAALIHARSAIQHLCACIVGPEFQEVLHVVVRRKESGYCICWLDLERGVPAQ